MFACSQLFVGIPVMCLSPLHSVERIHICTSPCNAHVYLPTTAVFSHPWARLRHAKVASHIHVSFASALTETRRSGSLFLLYFTLVAEPRYSASGLDRSTQQGELRSSAMSGGTDRREDEQVPQF